MFKGKISNKSVVLAFKLLDMASTTDFGTVKSIGIQVANSAASSLMVTFMTTVSAVYKLLIS
jgi:hypothetical protein